MRQMPLSYGTSTCVPILFSFAAIVASELGRMKQVKKGFRGKRDCTNLSRLQRVHCILPCSLNTIVFLLEKNMETQ